MLYVNPLASNVVGRFNSAELEAAREKTALREMEQYFAFTLLREMRKSVPQDTFFGGGSQGQMFEEMLDDALSAEMAKTGQLGIAAQIEGQLRMREAQQQSAAEAPGPTTEPLAEESQGFLPMPTRGAARFLPVPSGVAMTPLPPLPQGRFVPFADSSAAPFVPITNRETK